MRIGVIHYSTDVIYLWYQAQEHAIPYNDLERTLPVVCANWVREHEITSLIVINGPGGFTALRIGSLTVQTIKEFSEYPINLYEISKIDLYTIAVEAGFLPHYGLVGIGQRKKMRHVVWTEAGPNIALVTDDVFDGPLGDMHYFVDYMAHHLFLEKTKPHSMVSMRSGEACICLNFGDVSFSISYDVLMKKGPVEEVLPNYMIEPTLS